jgi:large subunit ribosomal protein L30|tara:strand:+ start:663 stop:863 length:201 start_codon:yes stop_codon:yes gene_type:complete
MKNKTTKNKTLKITQIKSTIGRNKKQKKNLLSLGLRKIGNSKSIILNKSTEGLIKKINHLIKIEKV